MSTPAPTNKMKVYKNVIVERNHTDLKFPETVPCYANFDYTNPIGVATLKYEDIGNNVHEQSILVIMADICLFEDKWNGSWPALGYFMDEKGIEDKTVYCLGICGNPNVDDRIQPLHDVIFSGALNSVSLTPDGYGVGMSNVKFIDQNPNSIPISSFERILPEGTSPEWGLMATFPEGWIPADGEQGIPVGKVTNVLRDEPIGVYKDGEVILNDHGKSLLYPDDNPVHHPDSCHHPKQHSLECGRVICMDCGAELFSGRVKG